MRRILSNRTSFTLGSPTTSVTDLDLHIAGNDARFALHALLMAAVRDWNYRDDKPKSKPTLSTQATLSSIKAIAKAWRRPDEDQPSLLFFFEEHIKAQVPPKTETRKNVKKPRQEKTPEEKAQRRERKKLAKAKRRLKEARRPQWLFNLGNLLDDE
ncbi:hypothetical protein DL766_009819 [Monosporascus sp. MC13-8B]|uniref:Uncharacterized protein n=1 Tax=Monosporascus cannonballus TaxID=155416 RepID=A0ABY0H4V4_9PEZI|nr:hypothetical protein DL762_005594 [Monosporascus cannonballus]RYP13695.1 hypothetical protein DL766_009819 [Monosporascus sp. MC13-8B]